MKPIRMSTLGKFVWLLFILILIVIVAFILSLFKEDKNYRKVEPVSKEEEKVVDYTSSKMTKIDFNSEVKSENNIITLTKSETYKISGINDKYKIVVDAPNKVVKIVFSNFSTSVLDKFIEVKSASKIILEFEENTKNEFKEIISEEMLEENIFLNTYVIDSNVNVEIMGNGNVIVDSDENFLKTDGDLEYSDAIVEFTNVNTALNVKGNVKVNSGVIYINSNDVAIKANGSFTASNGKIIAKTLKKPIDISGVFIINSGEILLASTSEFQVPNANSLQKSLILNFEKISNKVLVLHDTQKVIMAYDGKKDYQHILYSCPKLDADKYVLYAGGSVSGKKNYDLFKDVDDYLEDYQLTSPDFTNSTFNVPDLITVYNGIVKK